jgi:glycosyltransferase 2 family protein
MSSSASVKQPSAQGAGPTAFPKVPLWRSRLAFLLRIGAGLVLLAIVLISIDPRAVIDTVSRAAPGWLVLLGAAVTFDRALMAFKWNGLLRARGVSVPAARALRVYYVGSLLGTVTPGAIGGEVYRAVAVLPPANLGDCDAAGRREIVIASILLERFVGLVVIGVLAAALLPWYVSALGADPGPVIWAVAAVAAVLVGGLFVALRGAAAPSWVRRVPVLGSSRIAARLGDLYAALVGYRRHPAAVARFVALTALEASVQVLLDYLAVRALGIHPPLSFLCAMPLLHLLIRLPLTFEGLGLQEGLFALFLHRGGHPGEAGVAASLLLRLAFVALVLIPAAIALSWSPSKPGSKER